MIPEIDISDSRISITTDRFKLNVEITRRDQDRAEDTQYKIGGRKPAAKSSRPALPVTGTKVCIKCGDEYKPNSNRQKMCPVCKLAVKRKKKPLSEQEEAELEQSMREIEQRRKQPYSFEK